MLNFREWQGFLFVHSGSTCIPFMGMVRFMWLRDFKGFVVQRKLSVDSFSLQNEAALTIMR